MALEILEQLFTTQSCAYRLEHYWTYELCHGRYIRQYHEEREGKNVKLTEYTLGKYDAETLAKDIERARQQTTEGAGAGRRKPLKKKIDTLTLPYYELTMTDGTVCDLNGQPRITHVNYVCYPAGKHEVRLLERSAVLSTVTHDSLSSRFTPSRRAQPASTTSLFYRPLCATTRIIGKKTKDVPYS